MADPNCERCNGTGSRSRSVVHPTNPLLDTWESFPCGCKAPTHTTDLYFEAHITIAPVTDDQKVALMELGHLYGYRMATFLLKKGSTAVPDDFFTARGTSYDDLLYKTLQCVLALKDLGVTVKRYKIENTLLDVKLP